MKYIYTNLKRFDVPVRSGGVNRLAPVSAWGSTIVSETQKAFGGYADEAEFTFFFPEAHLLAAVSAKTPDSRLRVGCQGVYRDDIVPRANFGAFTTNRPAAAAAALGCETVIIGHCEERRDKAGILAEAGITDTAAVNRILNSEMKTAASQGLKILYCIGETAEEQASWQSVLRQQLDIGLNGLNTDMVVVAYEPVWAIGPGKTPPGKEYISMVAQFIKEHTHGLPVVYGGGLKADNAAMLSSIPEIDGGLIALTRFSGEIGFYPQEYLEIIRIYLGH